MIFLAIVALFNCDTRQLKQIIDNTTMWEYGGQCAQVYYDEYDTKETMQKIRSLMKDQPIRYVKMVGEDLFEKTQQEKDDADRGR